MKNLAWKRHSDYCHMRQAIDKDRTSGFVFMASFSVKGKTRPTECQCKSGLPIIAVLPISGSSLLKGFCSKCKPLK